MKAGRALFAVCALGASVSAMAIPSAPDEAGIVRNPPLEERVLTGERAGNVDDYFARYDVNRDGVISQQEAQGDSDLANVFARADANNDGVLTRDEFQTAAVLAVNERQARGG